MTINVTGLISKNSLEYIQHAFITLNNEGTFVNLTSAQDPNAIEGIQILKVQDITSTHGWYKGTAYTPNQSTSIAQISYTSGTEGEPKGVMISHAALANTTQRLIDIMQIDSSIREYIGVPVNYSFGFGRCRVCSAAGGQFYLPEHGFNPLEISQMLESGEINAISAVPSLWRLVLETPEIFEKTAKRVRWIEIGSQYMSADEKKQLRALFCNARIIQHYGLTEASRSTFLDIQNTEDRYLESVGKGYFGVETSISPNGRIKIRGPHLASSLLTGGNIKPVTDTDGWLVTSDAGHIDDGYLYFDGRMDDIINLGGTKLAPENLEAALRKQLGIHPGQLTIFRTSHATLGDQINIAVLREADIDPARLRTALQKLLSDYGLKISSKLPIHLLDTFPVTSTGKIRRNELGRIFSETEKQTPGEPRETSSETSHLSDQIRELVSIWEDVLSISPISPQDNFFDIGGDSLSAIRVTLRMEKAGIPKEVCRKIFEGFSIENLVASLEPQAAQPLPRASMTSAVNHTAAMIAIWQDVLKIDNVTENDGFFDLGGDSLSAIRVVVRMEAAGIPKETCRKIFEGHSIRDIVNLAGGATAQQSDTTAQQPSGGTGALIAIWQDVLKIDNVSENDSFFDLGGDSLSAIRVVVRMEAAGIPKETCRKIFEGHSIRDIVNSTSGIKPQTDNAAKEVPAINSRTSELIAIWQDVLKIDNVSENDSFFDLGGDSLSAIRVVVRMESAGIPKETCRKIFEGQSIRDIVSASPIENPGKPGPSKLPNTAIADYQAKLTETVTTQRDRLKRTPVSAANLTLNVIRGLLVLMNIAAHWIPAVVARMPSIVGDLNRYLAPLYSSGTPGFAMVFGAGLSFFVLPRFNKNKASVNKLCTRNALLLGTGISCMAAVIVAVMYFSGAEIVPTDVSNAFYSVLFYYFFAVISIPVWLRILTWKGTFTASCLIMACVFYACHLFIDALNIPPSDNPLVQTGILILTPKYNYLEMSAAVMLGAATGSWVKRYIEEGRNILPFLTTGIALIALSIIISIETGEYVRWFDWPKGLYLWTWPFYLGCILVGFYYLYRYIDKHDIDSHPVIGLNLRVISVVGVMAFPLFIGHEMVRPVAELLGIFSIPGSLLISLATFFGISLFLVTRLYRVYYAGKN